jgi:3'-5' exonuclease
MAFAIFDIETRIDKHLLNEIFCREQRLSDDEAFERFRGQLRERGGSDFPPLVLHVPISIAVGNVGDDHVLRTVENLALADYSEQKLTREFWTRAEQFNGCLVTFNGRRFDLPVLELNALRHGIAAPAYFGGDDSPRSRHAGERHLDLHDFLTNYGAAPLRGGLDALLRMIGMPGKSGIDGSRVQEFYDAGRLDEIHRYCRADVIRTYFLFIRVELMRGRLDEAAYAAAYAASAHFLAELTSAPDAAGAGS